MEKVLSGVLLEIRHDSLGELSAFSPQMIGKLRVLGFPRNSEIKSEQIQVNGNNILRNENITKLVLNKDKNIAIYLNALSLKILTSSYERIEHFQGKITPILQAYQESIQGDIVVNRIGLKYYNVFAGEQISGLSYRPFDLDLPNMAMDYPRNLEMFYGSPLGRLIVHYCLQKTNSLHVQLQNTGLAEHDVEAAKLTPVEDKVFLDIDHITNCDEVFEVQKLLKTVGMLNADIFECFKKMVNPDFLVKIKG